MKLFANQLDANLERGLAPVYLIAGPELLLVEEACDAIRKRARRDNIDERVVLDADARFDWNQLGATGDTMSLFASRRLIELRLPSGKPGREGAGALRDWVKSGSDDVLLIKAHAWEFKSESLAWVKAIDKAGVYVPCWGIKPHQIGQWIRQRMASRGLNADDAACQFLAERLEGNLLAAAQEIERLALLHGTDSTLDLETLRAAVADSARFDAFRLTELTLTGQAGAAVRCIRGLAESDTPQPMIVFALARELQLVEAFQSMSGHMPAAQAMDQLKIWRSRQQAVANAARRLHPATLRSALAALSDLDVQSKSSARPVFWLGLERLCVGLAENDLRQEVA